MMDRTVAMTSTGGAKNRSGLLPPRRRTNSARQTPVAKNCLASLAGVLRGQYFTRSSGSSQTILPALRKR